MSFSDAPISFPGLFGDWQFTVPSKALNIGNGIYWYGIIIAAGMLLGLYFCMKQAHKYGLTEDNVIDTVLWAIPFSIIGARIYYVLFYLDLFRNSDGSINWSSTYRIWDGGYPEPLQKAFVLGADGLLRAGPFHRPGRRPLGQLYE